MTEMLRPERHISPDGLLELVVEPLPDEADWIIYFQGYNWHTHPDVLAGTTCIEAGSVIDQFVKELINDRLTVELRFENGVLIDVRPGLPADQDHSEEIDYVRQGLKPGATSIFRLWSGIVLYRVP